MTANGADGRRAIWSKQARAFVTARLDRASYLGLHLTLGLAVAVISVWAFAALLEEVLDADRLVRWDLAASQWTHAHTTPLGMRAMYMLTMLGSPVFISMLAIAGAIALLRLHRRVLLMTWIAAFVGNVTINQLLKAAVRRPRPPLGAEFLHSHTYSFPSGHAMGSVVGYSMLVYVLIVSRPNRGATLGLVVATSVLVLLIGVSRVYLGVHYPSDVLGGFVAGTAWVTVCVTGASVAQGRAAGRTSTHPMSG